MLPLLVRVSLLLVRVSQQPLPMIMPRLQLDLSAAALGAGQSTADTVDHGKARGVIGAAALGEGQFASYTDQAETLWVTDVAVLGEGQSAVVAVDHTEASVGPQCCRSW